MHGVRVGILGLNSGRVGILGLDGGRVGILGLGGGRVGILGLDGCGILGLDGFGGECAPLGVERFAKCVVALKQAGRLQLDSAMAICHEEEVVQVCAT